MQRSGSVQSCSPIGLLLSLATFTVCDALLQSKEAAQIKPQEGSSHSGQLLHANLGVALEVSDTTFPIELVMDT